MLFATVFRVRFANQLAEQAARGTSKLDDSGYMELLLATKHGNVRKVANTRRLTTVAGVGDIVYELFMARD